MPEISVVIPTHSRWPLLTRTLAGALAQEGVDHEVIVVDDCSTDETPNRLAELDEPRLRTLRLDPNRGLVGARNHGLEAAAGEWVAFLDDDDLWSPHKLRLQLAAAREADADVCYASAFVVDAEMRVPDGLRAPDPAGIKNEILERQVIPGGASCVIARTALAREVGGFDPRLPVVEDWDMWIRLLLAADEVARSCEFLVGYYQHGTSMVVADRAIFQGALDYIERKYADVRRERSVEIDTTNISRQLANAYRRAGDRRGAARIYLRAARRRPNLGNLVRAGGMLFGESAANRLGRHRPLELERPEWVDLYAPGGRLSSVAALRASG